MNTFNGRILAGRYLLDEYVAEGNFGAVYRGRQLLLDMPCRRVAVKISKATALTRDSARALFADAYRLAEAMDEIPDADARKHLVQILDLGIAPELDGRGFAVMEFVQGSDLSDEFARYRGPVPANIVQGWIAQACRALDGLHRLVPPLLHCDLKPDNIRLGLDKTVRVVDFGLSRRLDHTGIAAGGEGVVTYMSPETSQEQENTPASDVYSIGVVLYQGLTGRMPFQDLVPPTSLPRLMFNRWFYDQRRTIRPPAPSVYSNSTSPELDAIVLKCLEFNPARRYRDAGELLAALTAKPTARKPPSAIAQERADEFQTSGNIEQAESVLKHAARAEGESNEARLECSVQLAKLQNRRGAHEEAAAELAWAWDNLVKTGAALPTGKDRIDFLTKIVDAYKRAGNPFAVRRWETELTKLKTRAGGG